MRGADGAYRWFLVRSIPQRSGDGRIARWYGIHIDIEQQHRMQQSLVQAQDDLTRLLRSLSMAEMAASIAHELNQPLTAVVTHAYACREWLRSKPANLEKASATAEKIVQESTRASVVVSRVRALFRKEAQVRELTGMNRADSGDWRACCATRRSGATFRFGSQLARRSSRIGDGPGADSAGAAESGHERHGCDDAGCQAARTHHTVRKARRRTRFLLRWRIMARALLLKIAAAECSNLSSPPSRREQGWAWPSAAALSKRTMGGCGRRTPHAAAQSCNSLCGRNHDEEPDTARDAQETVFIVDDDESIREGTHQFS